ncbi:MAG: right-handed parallel beta-helix repeat-containing protein [Clostridia bacterium]|nr:right-handed parallel beta-helix repeat-containing protein [Clostridia bacterium]
MLIKYKDAAYNNKIEDLRNNGYTVNFVDFDYDDFVTEEGNPVPFIELQLPNGGKSYKDYTAIVAWSDYLENDDPNVKRTYSGMPVPSSLTVQDGDTPVSCYFVLEDTATEGVVRFSFAATSQGPFSNEDFSDFVGNVDGLMFIEGHEYALDPDTSLIVPNLEAFFAQASGAANFQLDIANKTKLLSLGDNEAFSAYRYYKIIPSIPHGESSVIEFDGTSYHTENSSYQLLPLPIEVVLNLRGYTEDELETTDVAEIYQTAEENSSIFEDTVTNEAFGCLHLQEPLIYPISRPLTLRSNIRIVGNGGTIMAYNMVNNSGTYVAEEMAIIDNTNLNAPVSNVTFASITFRGTFPFRDANNNPIRHDADVSDIEAGFAGDTCIKTDSGKPMLKNLKFEKVTFTGFKYAAHTVSENDVLPVESSNWLFNNCEFNNVETGFMLTWIRGVTITNSHIDNSACIGDKHHCVYIARGCSHITVDNCLLENSIGAGIDVSEAAEVDERKKMHHCTFTNLQIRNCCIGVNISSPSEYITVKNIFVTNVARALRLANCTEVVVDNFNASGCFYFEYIRKDEGGETRWLNSSSEWVAIAIHGYVEATISNSFFSTGGTMFSSHTSGLLSEEFNSKAIHTNLEFKNCTFVSTFSEYKLGSDGVSYYQPGASLGVNNSDLTQPYVYNVDFHNCRFFMNSENNKHTMISLRGSKEPTSNYNFNNCLIAYRDGNGNPNDDVLSYDKHGNPEITMPNSYFISPEKGAFANIINCVFYKNRQNSSNSSNYGFIKNEYRDDNDELVARYRIEPDVDCETFASTYIKELN